MAKFDVFRVGLPDHVAGEGEHIPIASTTLWERAYPFPPVLIQKAQENFPLVEAALRELGLVVPESWTVVDMMRFLVHTYAVALDIKHGASPDKSIRDVSFFLPDNLEDGVRFALDAYDTHYEGTIGITGLSELSTGFNIQVEKHLRSGDTSPVVSRLGMRDLVSGTEITPLGMDALRQAGEIFLPPVGVIS